ncbi:MAG: NOB1 family endonuclease [Candidatus Kariarchaeaceae archaeon]|jgi:UPF0271 protein
MKYVVDSGIFMNQQMLPSIDGEIYLCRSVLEELKGQLTKNIYNLILSTHKISEIEPEKGYLQKVEQSMERIGQISLSNADKDLLALALMLSNYDQVILISDDYALRNVAHDLQINSKGSKTHGGGELRKYHYVCQACGKKFKGTVFDCDICGSARFRRIRRN